MNPKQHTKSVANFILDLAKSDGTHVTPMKLLKLAYISHGFYLATYDEALLNEYSEAWKFGPVVPSLYHEFKVFGNGAITRKAQRVDHSSDSNVFSFSEYELQGNEERELVKAVWENYSQFDGVALSKMTHRRGTPWYKTWHELGGSEIRGMDIKNDLIKDHYNELLAG